MYLEIILPFSLEGSYTYSYNGDVPAGELTGRRALVPLRNKYVTGVIVGTSEKSDYPKTREIAELLDDRVVFNTKMLDFTSQVAEYYLCSRGEVIRAAMPPGALPKSIMRIKATAGVSSETIDAIRSRAPKRAAILDELLNHKEGITLSYLEGKTDMEIASVQISALEDAGLIECEESIEGKGKGKRIRMVSLCAEYRDIDNIGTDQGKKLNERQYKIIEKLIEAEDFEQEVKIISEELKIGENMLKTLEKRGVVELFDIENFDLAEETGADLSSKNEAELKLSYEQQKALNAVKESIDKGSFSPYLLYGITGSGKTLVYIQAIKYANSLNKTALLLVPEIALTPQLIDRFKRAFDENIAVMHSRMTPAERFKTWRLVTQGKVKLLIGVRSVIYAPLQDLGLIIVDEEHEPSYKQESPAPRYNARDAALMRGRTEGAVVVLGSATPSLESYYNACTGKYNLLRISERADGASLPEVYAVDMISARRTKKVYKTLSEELCDNIISNIEKKQGTILFLNRRGYSIQLSCHECGFVPECNDCSVSLTYHKYTGKLQCHYCGYTINTYRTCPSCGSPEMLEIGGGTQRIEEDLKEYLSEKGVEAVIERMDLDTTKGKGSHRGILERFATGKTDVLIGTQMVAKGLDFERVTLVGIINPDLQLMIPDFRASERTYQLLTQVAGRAGRCSELPGKVIIQTAYPNNPTILSSIANNFERFYEEETEHRKKAFYPPYSRFIMIEISGQKEEDVENASLLLYNLLPKKDDIYLKLGPSDPAIPRIKKYYRKLIVLKGNKINDPAGKIIRKIIKYSLDEYNKRKKSADIRVTVDIDSYTGI